MFNLSKIQVKIDDIYDIKSIVYRFSRNTLLRADASISHIKRNKKIYKKAILYLAICLSPMLIECSKYLIDSFIYELSRIPKEHLFESLFDFFRIISLRIIALSIAFDICIKVFKVYISNIKNNI